MRVSVLPSRVVVEDYLLFGWSRGSDVSSVEFQVRTWGPEDFDKAAAVMLVNPEFLAWRKSGRPSKVHVPSRKRLCMSAFNAVMRSVKIPLVSNHVS